MNISDPQSLDRAEHLKNSEEVFYSADLSEMPVHPWELAQSTLANLLEYSEILERMSDRAAQLLGLSADPDHLAHKEKFFESFTKLIDGIDLFAQGIDGVKRILNTLSPNHPPELRKKIDLLEIDLLTNLKFLLKGQEEKNQVFLEEVLRDQLPRTLQEWRETGIPSLIRARDC